MDWLRDNSTRRGQRLCGMTAAVDEVTVQRSAKGVSFGGLLTCGSRTCPSCGPRIAAQTRTEIEQAIDTWMNGSVLPGSKRRLLFGTFTIRHKRGQKFVDLAAAVSKAWGAATSGRAWQRDRALYGIAHSVRVFEQKVSTKNGWHIHVHVLFFVDEVHADLGCGTTLDPAGLLGTMFKRWASKAVSMGFGVPLLRAQDMHEVTGSEALDRLADYFVKETTDAGERVGSLAAEMTNSEGKQGVTSLTPGQLLAWAIAGEEYIAQLWGPAKPGQKLRGAQGQEYARMLYREFEVGMKGRRAIAWSYGMRDALGLGRELTDEELAAKQEAIDAATRETLVSLSGSEWRKFVRPRGRRAELFAVAGTLSAAELVEWLAGYGVVALPHRQDSGGGVCFEPAYVYDGDLPSFN